MELILIISIIDKETTWYLYEMENTDTSISFMVYREYKMMIKTGDLERAMKYITTKTNKVLKTL